jgi:hypothetical protein
VVTDPDFLDLAERRPPQEDRRSNLQTVYRSLEEYDEPLRRLKEGEAAEHQRRRDQQSDRGDHKASDQF